MGGEGAAQAIGQPKEAKMHGAPAIDDRGGNACKARGTGVGHTGKGEHAYSTLARCLFEGKKFRQTQSRTLESTALPLLKCKGGACRRSYSSIRMSTL